MATARPDEEREKELYFARALRADMETADSTVSQHPVGRRAVMLSCTMR